MANYRLIEPQAGMAPVTQTGTVQQWPLGYVARAEDKATGSAYLGAAEFIYVKGAAASQPTAGDFVFIIGNSIQQIGSASSQLNYPIGVAAGAVSASNVYGWVQVKGLCDNARVENATIGIGASAFIGSNTDSNGLVASTQTAAGHALLGVFFPVTVASNTAAAAVIATATVQLNYPRPAPGSAL